MSSAAATSVQGHRLLQIGVALFLFTSFEGFAIPGFASPMLGRSTPISMAVPACAASQCKSAPTLRLSVEIA